MSKTITFLPPLPLKPETNSAQGGVWGGVWGGGRVRPYHILNNFCPRLCFMRVDFSVKESTPISRTVAMSWKSQPHSNKKKNHQRWQMFRPNLKQYKTSFKNSFPVFFSKLFLHQKNIIAHAVKKFAPIADGGWKKNGKVGYNKHLHWVYQNPTNWPYSAEIEQWGRVTRIRQKF